ncbi:MAG: universal stress protein [Ignavibacteria bacterium]|nr:MAG: universal stress protein [Ignavibacteria bacterium]KAF0161056.1 MAG: universal stress protein [Ignavibacteria bacterium]
MAFKKIGLAITFSPNSQALLFEAKRFRELFKAELVLIHIGDYSEVLNAELTKMIDETGIANGTYKLLWQEGDVEDSILELCTTEKIDLLIAGALIKENFLKYYIGSVARTLMREAPCSVLLLTQPSVVRAPFKKICVSVDFSSLSEPSARKAYEVSSLLNCKELFFIREFQLPALATTVYDSGSKEEAQQMRRIWQDEEKNKMELFVRELNITDADVKTVCLYGKQGWEASNWVSENKGDLFVIPSPARKPKLLDRIFQHDWEFVFKQLPCSLLIVKPENAD